MKFTVAYFGSPDFAADLLKKIISDSELPVEVKLVVTQPDKKIGRKQIMTSTPVKQVAVKHGIEACEDISLLDAKLTGIDICLVYAYAKIIPEDVLKIPRLGFWNIHPSILPKYRGPSPMVYPLLLGKKMTGVSLMFMDKEMDHGPILEQQQVAIDDTMTRKDLEKKLTDVGYEMIKEAIILAAENNITDLSLVKMQEQNHSHATYTRKLKKEDGFVPLEVLKQALEGKSSDWLPEIIEQYENTELDTFSIHNLFRALYQWPGIWTKVIINNQELRLKITDIDLTIKENLIINKVQLEGKNEVDFKTFNTAYKVF